MRLDELFKNLGYIAATIGSQMRDTAFQGIPLEELDLTGPAPHKIALLGPAQVVVTQGEVFRVDVEPGSGIEPVLFTQSEGRLGIGGGDTETIVRVAMPAPRKLALAGSGRMTVEKLASDGKVSIAGSGRLEVAAVEGGRLGVSIAGSGRLAVDGQVDELDLSIAGSGSCDAEGLLAGKVAVHVAGSGDAIFTCNGEVVAHLMGSGNVIVIGSARCNVHSMGSGTLTCERDREAAD